MKYLLILALTLFLSQNLLAEEQVETVSAEAGHEITAPSQTVMVSKIEQGSLLLFKKDNPFKPAQLDLTDVEYYKLADKPNYQPKNTIFIGGILPWVPIRSTIDASIEDEGLFQKSVSFLMYFKQKF